jgi:hypothetical protein
MIVLVLIAAWLLVLSLVVAVCASARTGDAHILRAGTIGEPGTASPWAEVPDPVRIVVRAKERVASVADDEASLVGSDSVAA